MSRSKWKLPFIEKSIYNNNLKKDQNTKTTFILNTSSRHSVILKTLIGKTVNIYNGKIFLKKTITKEMVGHKFGEISYTRSKYVYKESKKKKK